MDNNFKHVDLCNCILVMDSVEVATIIPTRMGKTGNIIICHKVKDLGLISEQLEAHVANAPDENDIEANVLYALNTGRGWNRASLKFVNRVTGVKVLHLLDQPGLYDFNERSMRARKITDAALLQEPIEMKMMIYGVGPYVFDDEFELIFNQTIKNEKVTAVYALLEQKDLKVHEAYVADFLFKVGSRVTSFRDILIKEDLCYPSQVHTPLNQAIFRFRNYAINVLKNIDGIMPLIVTEQVVEDATAARDEIFTCSNSRFRLQQLIGEGGVSDFGKFVISGNL